jgi:hypothetical protein
LKNKSVPEQVTVLEDLGAAVKYREWLLSLTDDLLGPRPFELGSGLGSYAAGMLQNNPDIELLTLSELDPVCISALKKRFDGNSKVKIIDLNQTKQLDGIKCTSLVSFNVFEHIENDLDNLIALKEILNPGSPVVIFVPAHQHLYSKFDAQVNHHRRYSKKSLFELADNAQLKNVEVIHFNFLGYFNWLIFMKFFRKHPKDGKILRILDRNLIPLARAFESKTRVPFGQSLVLKANVT